MTDQFLKDIEADIAKLNAALEELSDDENINTSVVEEEIGPNTGVNMDVSSKEAEEDDLPDLENMMQDHAALLLKIDNILMHNTQSENGDVNNLSEYNQQPATTDAEIDTPSDLDHINNQNENQEEDYFKGMNNFVESEEIVDTEKLYDLLELNLNYQDFLFKLSSEIEKRLEVNRSKQKDLSEAEDMRYLVTKGQTMSAVGGLHRQPHSRVISLQRFKPPYFTNAHRHGPLKNQDQLRLAEHPRNEMYVYESMWGKIDKQILLSTIKDVIIEEKMTDITMTQDQEAAALELERLKSKDRDFLISESKVDDWCEENWKEVSMRLASAHIQRSRHDCRLQWDNNLSPNINQGTWTKPEDDNLKKLVKIYGANSWSLVAQKLGTKRRSWQCLQRYSKIKSRPIVQWGAADDKHLQDAVNIYGDQSFSDLSYYLGDRGTMQCLQRWRYSICPSIKRGKWTQKEDEEVLKIVDEFGFDWQKIKDVQKNRTRAQVKERLRILAANKRAGSNSGTYMWTAKECIDLMKAVQKHGDKNWSAVREEIDYKYTAPLLFRRWNRIHDLLTGNLKRMMSNWEKILAKEILHPKKFLTPELQTLFKDMLPNETQKKEIYTLLSTFSTTRENQKMINRMKKKKLELKRKLREDASDVSDEDSEEEELGDIKEPSSSCDEDLSAENGVYDEIMRNAGKIYKEAFKVSETTPITGGKFKMCYTPPSFKTVSAFQKLLCSEYPKLKERSGINNQKGAVSLPEEVLADEEFKLLSARFKSLFSWPLIMGETPVV